MRKHIVPLLAMLALVISAPLAAQSAAPPGHMDTPGATYSTGTVVSQSDNAITIQTDAGETRIFLIDNATVGVQDYAVGTRVKVDFVVDDQSRAIAKRIMGHSEGEAFAEVEETPAVEAEAEATATVETEPAEAEADLDTEMDEDAGLDEDFDADADEELPATASPLGLLALLGLGGLGAGAGLRIARKR